MKVQKICDVLYHQVDLQQELWGWGVKCQGTNRSIFEKGAGATNLDVQGESKGARLLIPNKLNQQ